MSEPSDGVVPYILVFLAFVPMLLVAYRFTERVLRPRSVPALRAIEVAVGVFLVLPAGDPTTIATVVVAGAIMPVACYRGDWRERVLVAALILTSVAVAEILSISFWKVATGGAPAVSVAASWEHYPAHVASTLFGALVLGMVLWGFSRQLPDVLACLHEGQIALAAFLVAQSAALFLTSVGCMFDTPATGPIFWAADALCVLSLVADVEVFRAAGRLRVRGEERRRARFYEQHVKRLAAQTRAEVDAMSEVAMMRHDLRGHWGVLSSLVSHGELAEAGRYARELLGELNAGRGDEGAR